MVRWQYTAPIFLAITICFPLCSPAQQQNQNSLESRTSFPARLEVNKNLLNSKSINSTNNSKSGSSYWQNRTGNTPPKLQYKAPNGSDSGILKQTDTIRLAKELTSVGKGARRQQDDLSIVKAAEKSAMDDLLADEDRELKGLTLRDWPRQTIGEIPIDPRDLSSQVPEDRSAPLIDRFARNWSQFESTEKIYQWEAPNIYYRPLYFEDVALERYGQTCDDHWQTAISAAHFFSSACLLPLHMRVDPIRSCDYPLGYCRPGNCTNRIWQRQFWGLHHLHHQADVR